MAGGNVGPQNTALIIIDAQTDSCGKGGWVDLIGCDITPSRARIESINAVLRRMRTNGYTSVALARWCSPVSFR